MAKRRKSRIDKKKEKYWLDILSKWEATGETARAFCRANEINSNNFHWWKRVLRDRGKWPLKQASTVSVGDTFSVEKPVFSEIQLKRHAPSHCNDFDKGGESSRHSCGIHMTVRDHYRLEIAAGFDEDTLKRLLTVLETAPC